MCLGWQKRHAAGGTCYSMPGHTTFPLAPGIDNDYKMNITNLVNVIMGFLSRSCVLPPSAYFTMAVRELTRHETVWEGFSEKSGQSNGWRDRSWVTSSSVLDLNSAWFSIPLFDVFPGWNPGILPDLSQNMLYSVIPNTVYPDCRLGRCASETIHLRIVALILWASECASS